MLLWLGLGSGIGSFKHGTSCSRWGNSSPNIGTSCLHIGNRCLLSGNSCPESQVAMVSVAITGAQVALTVATVSLKLAQFCSRCLIGNTWLFSDSNCCHSLWPFWCPWQHLVQKFGMSCIPQSFSHAHASPLWEVTNDKFQFISILFACAIGHRIFTFLDLPKVAVNERQCFNSFMLKPIGQCVYTYLFIMHGKVHRICF